MNFVCPQAASWAEIHNALTRAWKAKRENRTTAACSTWACVCPGNNESAGKQRDGRTRRGNPWLRRTICEAAWGASRTKNSYFHAQYKRLQARRGPERALIAVAHSMIIIGYFLVKGHMK